MENSTIILGVMTALFGTGFFGTLIKIFVIDKKRNEMEIAKIREEIRKAQNENEDADLQQVAAKTKVVRELLADARESAEAARALQLEQSRLLDEKQGLEVEILGQKAVIEDHRLDRKDWMEMLKTTLEERAKRNVEFEELKRKVEVLSSSEKNCQENVASLEGRLNITIGILQKNNMEIPEGLIWTNSETHQVYGQKQDTIQK